MSVHDVGCTCIFAHDMIHDAVNRTSIVGATLALGYVHGITIVVLVALTLVFLDELQCERE